MISKNLLTVAWILAGLLAVAGMFISLGRQDTDVAPQVSSYGPSGISAFTELLRQRGIPFIVDRQSHPALGPDDIAVNFKVRSSFSGLLSEVSTRSDASINRFWDHVDHGGQGILLPVEQDFLAASQRPGSHDQISVKDSVTGIQFKVSDSTTQDYEMETPTIEADSHSLVLWKSPDQAFLSIYRVGSGTALVARDAIGITNRFIDRGDNAKAFLSMISILMKPGKRLVFTEASIGNLSEKGLFESIGPWANAAWQQGIFVGVVIIFTLGKRFGLPELTRVSQRGSRELLDALGDTFQRARSTSLALATAYDRADLELRRALKLPKDATRNERDRLLPSNLQNALARLDAASQMTAVAPDQALKLIRQADHELELFLGARRTLSHRLAKLWT